MARKTSDVRILITGFGPFPGAPVNPTGPLIRALARALRKEDGVSVTIHTFRTTYAAVDRDLPRLLVKVKPQALLMFGLATRSRGLRVETQARNRICRFPDAAGIVPATRRISDDARMMMPIRAPKMALLRAAKSGPLSARLSVNAGDYLCNYLYWHALAATERGGLSRAAFVHVPLLDSTEKPRSPRSMDNLLVAARAIADTMIKAARPRQ